MSKIQVFLVWTLKVPLEVVGATRNPALLCKTAALSLPGSSQRLHVLPWFEVCLICQLKTPNSKPWLCTHIYPTDPTDWHMPYLLLINMIWSSLTLRVLSQICLGLRAGSVGEPWGCVSGITSSNFTSSSETAQRRHHLGHFFDNLNLFHYTLNSAGLSALLSHSP